jgi:signal transduction histidine kinase/CheY-like chemotaxis protein
MISAPCPENEPRRLAALRSLDILDSEVEALYDEMTALAAEICEAPISLVSLVDENRQWFKSRHGLAALETPREVAFCAHAILGNDLFEVEDSRCDPRFRDNPLVTGDPHVIFYAGVPLSLGQDLHLGTLCVIDDKPRRLSDKQRRALKCPARQVEANLRLRQANLELQRVSRVRDGYVSVMSHELRTPMNGILGITELLMGSTRENETREQLKLVHECGDTMLSLLNDILDFKKIEAGKLEIDSHPFDPMAMLRGLREIYGRIAEAKGLTLSVAGAGVPASLEGDSTRIRQILANLLSNAVKFTETGTIGLAARVEPGPDGKIRLAFEVRDEGIGIPASALARLFTPYSQVDASTTRRFGGTGLGLAIVRGLAEGMGGEVAVASEPGKGSVFTVSVLCRTSVATPAPEPAWSPASAEPASLSILVAEDNPVNQTVILKQLARLGYTADLAVNGAEAVARALAKDYDVILMDCQMPEMDGFAAAKAILSASHRGLPPSILALTAGLMNEEKALCLEVGMAGILEKPLRIEVLKKALAAVPSRNTEVTPVREPRPG